MECFTSQLTWASSVPAGDAGDRAAGAAATTWGGGGPRASRGRADWHARPRPARRGPGPEDGAGSSGHRASQGHRRAPVQEVRSRPFNVGITTLTGIGLLDGVLENREHVPLPKPVWEIEPVFLATGNGNRLGNVRGYCWR